jgi:hypothetical protein
MSTIATDRPVVKIVTRNLTYFGSRAEVTTIHHDKSRLGLRTVRMHWIDDAATENGGWPAGTTTEKVIKGEGFRGVGRTAFEVIEAEKVVA